MVDDATTGASAAPLPHCMWCSAELPSDSEVTCPSCGATLIGEGDNPVPGVTAIDAEAIVRAGRGARPKQRSRLLSWISGEYTDDDAKPAPPGSLSPPPLEVRREMLRLELEAQVANLQAEAGAIAAEAAVESGLPIELPDAAEADLEAVASSDGTDEASEEAALSAGEDDESAAAEEAVLSAGEGSDTDDPGTTPPSEPRGLSSARARSPSTTRSSFIREHDVASATVSSVPA